MNLPDEHIDSCLDGSPSTLFSIGRQAKLRVLTPNDMREAVICHSSTSMAVPEASLLHTCWKSPYFASRASEKRDKIPNLCLNTRAISRGGCPLYQERKTDTEAAEQSAKAKSNDTHSRLITSNHVNGDLQYIPLALPLITVTPPGQERYTPKLAGIKRKALPMNSPLSNHIELHPAFTKYRCSFN